jgi:hypothetical protein
MGLGYQLAVTLFLFEDCAVQCLQGLEEFFFFGVPLDPCSDEVFTDGV